MKLIFYVACTFFCFLAVAFYTLMERKVLAYSMNRVGPNKVSVSGIFQPMADALKLLPKQLFVPEQSNKTLFLVAPIASLTLSLAMFILFFSSFLSSVPVTALFFLSIIAISVFAPAFAGWSSGSFYAKLGGTRNLVQTVSFEITLFMIILFPLWIFSHLEIHSQQNSMLFLAFVSMAFIIVLLAETNRAPFDLSEGESELVSGFNIEYGGSGFVLLFLSEYAQIMSLCIMFSTLMGSGGSIMLIFVITLILVLLIRAAWPRLRYDMLMMMIWVGLLPVLNAMILIAIFV